eukprot:Gregarina_sp_Poly_1__1204@NODE_1296_length_4462_cov_58_443231_g876_i0_p1_GENE_NODE_1296_length_4462_cov_58_443231_g876_i0NODE_1296_length_4462_cov_58_443231_g876_i0_p1_ORF_typecomplete_len1247_score248_02DNA_pol_phi/PF04931_13/70DNA_pol_phi/PF04931_13/0_01CBP_BcsR/PF10945_8/47CBP_BcsR/PF10945_8/16SDA1/PF05285_12/4_7_NODE_1296_length_4462_cov_58_443231_g876_i0453785
MAKQTSRDFLDALAEIVERPPLGQRKKAIETLATAISQIEACTEEEPENEKSPSETAADRTIRISSHYTPIGNPKSKTHRHLTYLFNRLTISLGSTAPGVRESVGTAYIVLLNFFLRTRLLTENAIPSLLTCLYETLGDASAKAHGDKQSEEDVRCRRVGLLTGLRFILETGYFARGDAAADFSRVMSTAFALMEIRGFALIGGDLAADLVARFIRLVCDKEASPSIHKLASQKDSPTSVICASLQQAVKDVHNFTKSLTPGNNEIEIAVCLVPKIVLILKLKQLYDAKVALPKNVASIFSKFHSQFHKFVRAAVFIGVIASTRKSVPLASLWSMLFVSVVAADNHDDFKSSSEMPGTRVLLTSINECCFRCGADKNLSAALTTRSGCLGLATMMHILAWSKIVELCGAMISPLWRVECSAVVSHMMTNFDFGSGFRKFWFTSVSNKTHAGYDVARLFQAQLAAVVQGGGCPFKTMYEQALLPSGCLGKMKGLSPGERLLIELVSDPTPYGFFGVLESRPLCSDSLPVQNVHALYEAVFIKPAANFSEILKTSCWVHLLSEIDSLGLSSKAIYPELTALFGPKNLSSSTILQTLGRSRSEQPGGPLRIVAAALAKFPHGTSLDAFVSFFWALGHLYNRELLHPSRPESRLPECWRWTADRSLLPVVNAVGTKLKRTIVEAFKKDASEQQQSKIMVLVKLLQQMTGDETILPTRQDDIAELAPALLLPKLLFQFGIKYFVSDDIAHPGATLLKDIGASFCALINLANETDGHLVRQLINIDLEFADIPKDIAEDDSMAEALKFAKQFTCPKVLGHLVVGLLGERVAQFIDDEEINLLWSIVLGQDEEGDHSSQSETETAGSEADNDMGDADSEDEGGDPLEGSGDVENSDNMSTTPPAGDGDMEESEAEDEVLDLDSAQLMEFLVRDEENGLIAKKRAQLQATRKASREETETELARSLARRVRAVKLLEAKFRTLSFLAQNIETEALAELLGLTQKSLMNALRLWPLLAQSGGDTALPSESWRRRLLELAETLNTALRDIAIQLSLERAAACVKSHESLASNALVCYADMGVTMMETLRSCRLQGEELWKVTSRMVEGIGDLNAKLLAHRPPVTKEEALKLLLRPEDAERAVDQVGWLWSGTMKNDVGTYHPQGVRCHRCSHKKSGHSHCYTLQHAEAISTFVLFQVAGTPNLPELLKQNVPKFVRALAEVCPARLKGTAVVFAIAGIESKHLVRELLGVLHSLRA